MVRVLPFPQAHCSEKASAGTIVLRQRTKEKVEEFLHDGSCVADEFTCSDVWDIQISDQRHMAVKGTIFLHRSSSSGGWRRQR